jgi:phosphate starvation-inducible PhoH-like protein
MAKRRSTVQQVKSQHFSLKKINPLTENQQKTFHAYENDKHLVLHGIAGTGKTYISLYLALREVLEKDSYYKKIIIVRSVVPSRDMGFLPGTQKEKAQAYEEPYREICDDLFSRGDGYQILRMKGLVEFTTTSYLRGTTFRDAIVIVDECQNMTDAEIHTVMTRVGDNCRIVFCGDYRQTDLNKKNDQTGIFKFMDIAHNMKDFAFIEFVIDDIVRSDIVKQYIIARTLLEERMAA